MNAKKRAAACHGGSMKRKPFDSPHCNTGPARRQMPVKSNGKVIGHIDDGWLVKRNLEPSRHKMRAPAGWCTDAAHLRIPGLKGVRLHLADGAVLEATVQQWRRYGIALNRGHGEQVLLTDDYWTTRRPGETRAVQFSLFGKLP